MAQDEAKVRVRLDTRQAKGELRGLTQQASGIAGGVGAGLRRAVGFGVGALGLGAAVGAGVAAVRGPTAGAVTGMVSQAFGPLGEEIANKMFPGRFKDMGRAIATQQTAQTFGLIAGTRGAIPPGAARFHEFVAGQEERRARGESMIRGDPRFASEFAQEMAKEMFKAMQTIGGSRVGGVMSEVNKAFEGLRRWVFGK